jgi:DNA-3-methyladenine glycosylase II
MCIDTRDPQVYAAGHTCRPDGGRYHATKGDREVAANTTRLHYSPRSPEVQLLAESDPRMGALADAVGVVDIGVGGDRFLSLGRAIVGQQLSTKASSTIWARVVALGGFVPASILAASDAELRGAGLSGAKTAYLRDLATRVLAGEVDLEALDALADEEVITELTRVKGIGRWTAEMFLIFNLARPDVLALDDAGLLRAAGWLLDIGRPADAATLAEAGTLWRPLRSVASLYLWGALDRGLVPRSGQPGGSVPR